MFSNKAMNRSASAIVPSGAAPLLAARRCFTFDVSTFITRSIQSVIAKMMSAVSLMSAPLRNSYGHHDSLGSVSLGLSSSSLPTTNVAVLESCLTAAAYSEPTLRCSSRS